MQLMPFLVQEQVQAWQALNSFFYHHAVSRVQTRVKREFAFVYFREPTRRGYFYDSLVRYDLNKQRVSKPPIKLSRSFSASDQIYNTSRACPWLWVYPFGPSDTCKPLYRIRKLDGKVSKLAKPCVFKQSPSLAVYRDEYLISTGGHLQSKSHNWRVFIEDDLIDVIEVYEARTDTWSVKKCKVRRRLLSHTSCVLGDKLFLLGGRPLHKHP